MKCRFIIFLLFLPILSHANGLPNLIATIHCDTINTLFGYRIVPLGDQNNDGYDDFLTWDYRFKAFVYYGGNTVDTIPALTFDSVNSRIDNIGDVNGDNFDDFTALGRSSFNWKLNLYYGGPSIDTLRDAWFGVDSLFGTGFTFTGHDLNSNGTNEILTTASTYEVALLFELSSNIDSVPDMIIHPANIRGSFVFGYGITSGDFNGDDTLDLAVSLRYPSQQKKRGQVYLYWGGSSFDTIPDLIISRPGPWFSGTEFFGDLLESIGDFNGDGYDDFVAGAGSAFDDTLNFIYFGGPNIDTIPDITIAQRFDKARSAGDLNGDNYNDLVVSFPLQFTGTGDVRVYYGGPNADSIADIVITNNDMPQLQWEFGMDCSGVGDVNGDSINDFAFSAVENTVGTIYIFSGSKVSTGIEIEHESTLPSDYKLSQNYPNPFNPTTTIEFGLPVRSQVTLRILNSLGQKVATLLDKQLSAGSYKATWDGRDDLGKEVASGVYFYKLEAGDFVESKKMMLLK